MPTRIPLRWRLAGLLHRLPEFRGRDRAVGMLIDLSLPPDGVHEGRFGPDLRYEVRYRDDGSFVDLFFLQYQEPALAPVLRAVLQPGGTLYDVGANIGVYAGWGARLVGPSGVVHAFEPVPTTRAILERIVALNRLANVRIVPRAVGSTPGTLELHVVQGASGLTSAAAQGHPSPAVRVAVPVTTLDAHAAESATRPDLVLIDVEGYELEVLRGAPRVLTHARPPAVLFESHAEHLARCGTDVGEIVAWLEDETGLRVFGLTPRGLVPQPRTRVPVASNCLALHPSAHGAIRQRLERLRFRRNQSC
jgi:FkbM family methyltransferase